MSALVMAKPYSFFWQSASFDSMSLCVCARVCSKIFNDEKYSITIDDDMMLLVIDDSEITDSAIYRCEAVNDVDTVSTQCKVVVDERPPPDEPRTSSCLLTLGLLAIHIRYSDVDSLSMHWHQMRTLSSWQFNVCVNVG